MYKKLATTICIVLSACAGNPTVGGGRSNLQVLTGNSLPAPEASDLFDQTRPYRMGPFDKLVIDVFGMAELSNREVLIDAGGQISFPLVGAVDAAGKAPSDLEEILERKLRERFIRDPQVTVNLKEAVSQVVTVDGQVKQPGQYPVIGRMTIMRAIAAAKGLDEFARLDDVVLFRTVKGQKMAALYNLKAIRRGMYDDPEIFASDVIIVGDSKGRRLFKDLIQVLPLLSAPLIIAFR